MNLLNKLLPILFIVIGIGVPVYFTAKNSKPINIIRKIFDELKIQPAELWYHYFTRNGLDKWLTNTDFKIEDIQSIHYVDYNYENYIGRLKVKLLLANNELLYHFDLVKNPDIRAKSRWMIHDMHKI